MFRILPDPDENFLPNVCANPNVFLTVLIAELLAMVLALSNTTQQTDFWPPLGLLSLFVQWLALGSAAALCWSQAWLRELGTVKLTLAAYGLTQSVTIGFSVLILLGLDTLGAQDLLPLSPLRFVLRNFAISSIVVLVALRYFYIHHQWQLNIQAQAEARFQTLQSRIRPHFLFNSLNTIASLICSRPEQAENAVLDLADLFRITLRGETTVTLREELELSKGYTQLEALRLGERLHIDWRIAENTPLDTLLPFLILQPLLENAVYHGIERSSDGGTITVTIDADQRALRFQIDNPCGSGAVHQGSGIALDNIRRRLQLLYGERGTLDIQQMDSRFRVSVRIPLD